MEQDEKIVMNIFCELFNNGDAEATIDSAELAFLVSRMGTPLSRSAIEVVLKDLTKKKLLHDHLRMGAPVLYSLSTEGHRYCSKKTSADQGEEQRNSGTIILQNYEQIVALANQIVEEVGKDNERKVAHPLETQSMIDDGEIFAKSLLENKGKVLMEKVRYLVALFEKIMTIFEKVARVIDMITRMLEFLRPVLG